MGNRTRQAQQCHREASPPERLAQDDLLELQEVTGETRQAQAAFEQARNEWAAQQGVQAYLQRRLMRLYRLAPQDQIDLATGTITRVAGTPPAPSTNGHAPDGEPPA